MGISLEGDIQGVYKGLKATLTKSPKITKKLLRAAAMGGRGEGKKRVYQSLTRHTGETRKKVSFKMTGPSSAYVAVRTAWAANQVRGAEIVPRNREFLTFQVNGQWIKAKRVFIQPRWDFFGEMDRYFKSSAPIAQIHKVLAKELNKLWPSGVK